MATELRPIFSTTVDPSEYDIDQQMNTMVRLANKNCECYCMMDVGKIWGLYLAWRRGQTTRRKVSPKTAAKDMR